MALARSALLVWLAEDLGRGDLTSERLIAADTRCQAAILFKEPGVVSGLAAAEDVLRELDPNIVFETSLTDGVAAQAGELARVEGNARAILAGERLAVNLLARLSGIATLTRRFVDAVAGTGVTILDTRKTTPGLRALEKAAVQHGGGGNHRLGLYDQILIKDNHLRLVDGVGVAIDRARCDGQAVEVECESLADVGAALVAGANRILLDNMTVPQIKDAIGLCAGRCELEVSGGVTLENVRAIAKTGVDFISIGALTHSAPALDVSLEVLA